MADQIPQTMFAWRKHRGNPEPVWEEVPVPEVTPTGVLCKMIASGETQPAWFKDKWTLAGPEVKGFKVGDVVAMFATPGCGASDCPECSRELFQICERCHHSGIGEDGFYAPYAAIDQRGLAIVPEGVTPSEAAVACDAVTTAYHAVKRRAKVKASDTVFLFGLGGLGFNALQIIHGIGARVIVSDVRDEMLDEAEALGIPRSDIVPVGKSPPVWIEENGLYGKVDIVLDFVGRHQTFEDAQHIVRRAGKIVNVGSMDQQNTVHMKIGTRKRLTFKFSYGGQVSDLEEVLQLIAKGTLKPVVGPGKLEDFPTTLKDLVAGKIKGRVALLQE
ncbi:unnamed protein product [Parascedosporium putredinis]|uniref:Alcohol dehydrogenase n=1 Tax=Parascedosporium putredinis TaxID=1442378 RepID=A0A9P1MA85_9PEZI|nr:unnamed protein product [Parascedosporium putredinis]CAI7997017.1 unnamed protein product [Parascedosporium putredinis]